MNTRRKEAHLYMRGAAVYGSPFHKRMATAVEYADLNDLDKIKEAWPEAWSRYKGFGFILAQQDMPRA